MTIRRLLYGGVVAAFLVSAACSRQSAQDTRSSPDAPAAATPRMPNGQPDLTGTWANVVTRDNYGFPITKDTVHIADFRVKADAKNLVGGTGEEEGVVLPTRRCAPNQTGCRDNRNQATDYVYTYRLDPNRPRYKPELWDKVQDLDYDTNFKDPAIISCASLGVPRMGAPRKIVQKDNEVIFLYAGGGDEYRVIPTDGRPHDPQAYPTYRGDSVGRWEGDTLVVDSRNFTDATWITSGVIGGGGGGYFHSYEKRVIERLHRVGEMLHYQATVEDPEVLMEPWTMNAIELKLDPKAVVRESGPCNAQYDLDIFTSRVRH